MSNSPKPPEAPRKPKLPKVWVEFWESGNLRAAYAIKPKGYVNVHQYAPIQPPRRCVLTPCMSNKNDSSYKDTGCGNHLSGVVNFKFCPYCGGKIKVKR